MKYYLSLTLIALSLSSSSLQAQFSITGNITAQSLPVSGARITLFNSDTTFFVEERTNLAGNYLVTGIPSGIYTMGVAKINQQYVDTLLTINASVSNMNISLTGETEKGVWDVIMVSPERLGGTDLGVLMPDGKIFYCHDTEDPFYFDPETNDTVSVLGSTAIQGCVGPILNSDGKVWFFGGTLQAVYGPGTKKVKSFNPQLPLWQMQADMSDSRWYPTVSPLPDGNIIVAGGGGLNNPARVKTSEVYNPQTGNYAITDTIALGNEVSPIVPLYNGKTLMTHRPPQLFNPATNQWDLAADFIQSNRMSNGDHSDHELVLLPNGNVVAIGYKPFNNPLGTFVEMYDPALNQWSLKSSINPIRSRAKAVIMPDKRILVANGEKEDGSNNTPVNQWGYMKRTDLYNAYSDTWRNAQDMNYFREYHAIITLVPDGRLIAVGGEGQPGNVPSQSIIEAYKPPYLFRGVRPEIHNLSNISYARGSQINFNVTKTDSITGVHLMSNAVNTHFMNSSSNRFLELPFTQNNGSVTATLPTDSLLLHAGFYMLFVMADDIPSIARIIQVEDSTVSITTGINEIYKANDVVVYPNPTDGFIYLKSVFPIIKASITDLTGQQVISFSSENIESINAQSLSQGTYFLIYETENRQQGVKKIVKP